MIEKNRIHPMIAETERMKQAGKAGNRAGIITAIILEGIPDLLAGGQLATHVIPNEFATTLAEAFFTGRLVIAGVFGILPVVMLVVTATTDPDAYESASSSVKNAFFPGIGIAKFIGNKVLDAKEGELVYNEKGYGKNGFLDWW